MTDSTDKQKHPNLANGSRGDEVKRVQERLLELGYDLGAADGIYGPRTEAAVRSYQQTLGLKITTTSGKIVDGADGIVGPQTWEKLFPRKSHDYRGMNAVARLVQFNQRGKYVLGGGGVNPRAPTPFTWVKAQYGSDCVGAVMWGLETPRHHDSFPEYEGDINCDSAMMDAGLIPGGKGGQKFFAPVDAADVVPGTIVVYPSIRAKDLTVGNAEETEAFWKRNGFSLNARVRIGHIALVAGWEGLQDPFQLNEHPWSGKLSDLITVECRASWPAVRLGRNVSFLGNTKYSRYGETWENDAWGCRFMKYVGP